MSSQTQMLSFQNDSCSESLRVIHTVTLHTQARACLSFKLKDLDATPLVDSDQPASPAAVSALSPVDLAQIVITLSHAGCKQQQQLREGVQSESASNLNNLKALMVLLTGRCLASPSQSQWCHSDVSVIHVTLGSSSAE